MITLPAAPADLYVQFGSNPSREVLLKWKDNSLTETGYIVEMAVNPGEWAQYPVIFDKNTTSAPISNLGQNHTYGFRVRAHNSAGNSVYSNEISITTLSSSHTIIEAETALRDGGAGENTDHSGYSGSGFVDGLGNASAKVIFSINSPATSDQNYIVAFHYSAGNGTSTNMKLEVNGVSVKDLMCYNTGNSWDSWGDVTETVMLKPGCNVLTLKSGNSTNSPINLDYIIGLEPGPTEFLITASAGTNGEISPMGLVRVPFIGNQSFTISPNSGYEVNDILVDGNSQGATKFYTFSGVTADHTISASFRLLPPGGGNGLHGAPFGLSPSYATGSEYYKATDGDINTFYDYSEANGGYTGLDLGSAKVISKIRYYPRSNISVWRTVGGKFQGSNVSETSGYVDLYTIPGTKANDWNEVTISNTTAYRWVRYLSPDGGYCNIAEIEFYEAVFPVPNKWYKIATRANTNQCLDVTGGNYANNTAIELWGKCNVNQEFKFQSAGNGYYTITCRGNTSYSIDMSGNFANRQTLKLWTTDTGNNNQKFKLVPITGGYYRLESYNSGFSIDNTGNTDNSVKPYLWTSSDNNVNQQWVITEVQ